MIYFGKLIFPKSKGNKAKGTKTFHCFSTSICAKNIGSKTNTILFKGLCRNFVVYYNQ